MQDNAGRTVTTVAEGGPVQGPRRIEIVAFDADDTLWHNERAFRLTQERFRALLAEHADGDHLSERLLAAERRNLGTYGYGVKAFVLCMIEAALEVTDRRVPGPVIAEIVAAGREMLAHPVDLLPGAAEAVDAALSDGREVMIVTKGDLLDQERKVAASGLGDLVHRVEVVSEKDAALYRRLFAGRSALMAGNSLRSDVNPAIAAGAFGVYVPHGLSWAIEHDVEPEDHPLYRRIDGLAALPALIASIETG